MPESSDTNPVIDRCTETGNDIRATDVVYVITSPDGGPQLILHADALQNIPMQARDYANRAFAGQDGFNVHQAVYDGQGIFEVDDFHLSMSSADVQEHLPKCWQRLTHKPLPQIGPMEATEPGRGSKPDAPYCYQCCTQMQRAGSCHACPSCGATSGCL